MLVAKLLGYISRHTFSLFRKVDVVLVLILVGTIFRFFYPFFSHPLSHLVSDALRHYQIAAQSFNKTIFSWLDPPLPQFWLRTVLTLLQYNRIALAAYFGLLCAVTPWCWYLWGRKIFSDEKTARIYLAAMIWLPSWLGIYGFFMDETLLLPALGLTLWLSWKAKEKSNAKYFLLAILAWSITISIKLNSLFELVFVGPWLFFHFIKQNGWRFRSCAVLLTAILLLAGAYLSFPLWVYQGLRTTWLYPPGMGGITRIYYASGANFASISFVSHKHKYLWVATSAAYGPNIESLAPFSRWRTWRQGSYETTIDCDKDCVFALPAPHLTLRKHILFATEAALYFFFSPSYPEMNEYDFINVAQIGTRWLWSILTISIIVLSWRKKRFSDFVVLLFLGTTLLYLLCDSALASGRYRKPWEGIVIAAFVYLLDFGKTKQSRFINVGNPRVPLADGEG